MNNSQNNKNHKTIVMVEISGKGGICHYTYNLCRELSKLAQVILVTALDYELESLNKGTVKTEKIFNRFKTNPLKILGLFRLARNKTYQVVHFQLSQHPELISFIILVFKLFTKAKIVVTAHNVIDHEEKKYFKIFFKFIYKVSDAIILHAQSSKEDLCSLFRVKTQKIMVIPHGNYLFFNNSNAEPKLNFDNQVRYILFFGYIRKYKGLMNLIKAFDRVRNSLNNVKLIIVGKPVESFLNYESEIKKRALENNIILDLNYADYKKTQEYFTMADVVVLPYEKIDQSGVLQLAYAFAKPVIVTDVGGFREVVEDGKTGFIVPSGDILKLEEAIKKLLTNEALRKEMGERALCLAETRYAWDNIAEQTKSIYDGFN